MLNLATDHTRRGQRRDHPFAYLLVGALIFGLLGCEAASVTASSETLAEAAGDSAMAHAIKHLDPKYVCPMHPQIVKDEPGNCPICGMDLVAKMQDSAGAKSPEVTLSAAVVQNMGVRTTRVKLGKMTQHIKGVGRIEYDETRLFHVHPRAEGWIEGLKLRAEGEPVRRGQEIAKLYSPEILAAQVDYLIALRSAGGGVGTQRAEKARNLLRLLNVPEDVIGDIERQGETRNTVPVLAPSSGIVTRLMARDGMYVSPGTEMFTIADLKRVWVMVDIFEHQLASLRPGQSAEIMVPAHPGVSWKGKVDYLYPELDPVSRTLKVRLVFDNPEQRLKPNMFADVVIYAGSKPEAVKIPRDALIVTGERESVVKALGDGRFQPVDVVVGMQRAGEVEILSGLEVGDEVVVSGQFLIDSESNLQASFLRMADDAAATGQ